MDDVAQQSEGKSEIQATEVLIESGDWEATARMYWAALQRERAEHKQEILKLKEHKRLANELCGLLSKHCGETGESEGAADTLKRKLLELENLRRQKDGAYAERNQVLALLARTALALGWKVGVGQHPVEDAAWEKDWRTILFVDLPTGQCSWHFHDSEVHLLSWLPTYEGTWDGHTTPEKYDRVNHALRVGVAQVVEAGGVEEAAVLKRARAERFLPPLSLPQHEEILNGFSSSVNGAACREAYMRRHGLVYVEGVLHWQGDQTPTNPECKAK